MTDDISSMDSVISYIGHTGELTRYGVVWDMRQGFVVTCEMYSKEGTNCDRHTDRLFSL